MVLSKSIVTYLALRHLHIGAALLSITMFTLRGGLALTGQDWRRWKPLRWLPHVNDTVLLLAAISLAYWSGQYPIQQSWLTAKVLALLAYIGLGKLALRSVLPCRQRACWFVAALLCVGYILGVAHTRSAWLGH